MKTWTPLGKSHLLLTSGTEPVMLSLNKTTGNYDSRIAVITAAGGEGNDDHRNNNNNNNNNNEATMMMDGHIYSASTASWELNGMSLDDDILCNNNNKLSNRSASLLWIIPYIKSMFDIWWWQS
jgi:hypothetical protein